MLDVVELGDESGQRPVAPTRRRFLEVPVSRESIDTYVQEAIRNGNGGLSHLSPYIGWRPGDEEVTLDGDFTVKQLRQILDFVISAKPPERLHPNSDALDEPVSGHELENTDQRRHP